MRRWLKSQWLREPLLHFMLLGLGLFLLHGWVGGAASGEGTSIVITEGRIGQLSIGYERMHQRLPDPGELDALIDDAVREEIFYREAKAMGLDRDDTIIRRRLRQKLEFVSEDVAPTPAPTDSELQAHLQANAEKFRTERRYELTQVYLDPQGHGARLAEDTRDLLTELRRVGSTTDASGRGDASLLPQHLEKAAASEVSRVFGSKFESALQVLPIGQWAGPVPSGFGAHLVFLRERDEERAATLPEVRDEVRRDWIQTQHAEANARFYAELRARYSVTIARPAPTEASPGTLTGLRP